MQKKLKERIREYVLKRSSFSKKSHLKNLFELPFAKRDPAWARLKEKLRKKWEAEGVKGYDLNNIPVYKPRVKKNVFNIGLDTELDAKWDLEHLIIKGEEIPYNQGEKLLDFVDILIRKDKDSGIFLTNHKGEQTFDDVSFRGKIPAKSKDWTHQVTIKGRFYYLKDLKTGEEKHFTTHKDLEKLVKDPSYVPKKEYVDMKQLYEDKIKGNSEIIKSVKSNFSNYNIGIASTSNKSHLLKYRIKFKNLSEKQLEDLKKRFGDPAEKPLVKDSAIDGLIKKFKDIIEEGGFESLNLKASWRYDNKRGYNILIEPASERKKKKDDKKQKEVEKKVKKILEKKKKPKEKKEDTSQTKMQLEVSDKTNVEKFLDKIKQENKDREEYNKDNEDKKEIKQLYYATGEKAETVLERYSDVAFLGKGKDKKIPYIVGTSKDKEILEGIKYVSVKVQKGFAYFPVK